jgi:secreted PhoX family phosphatase
MKKNSRQTTSRRDVLATGLAMAAAATTRAHAQENAAPPAPPSRDDARSSLTFAEIEHGLDPEHHVSPGHKVQILIRWGDPVFTAAPLWSADIQTAEAQKLQFGYDNDYIAFLPLPYGSQSSTSGLLCVNHEATRNGLMFAGMTKPAPDELSRALVDVEMAANGHTVVKVDLTGNAWTTDLASTFNRRITAWTEIDISGPAAGHNRLHTPDDPTGMRVLGALGGCAGGQTPWGTVLLCEENIQHHFAGDPRKTAEAESHLAMTIGDERHYGWHRFYPRFDIEQIVNEPHRFGWVVEIDPFEPSARPVKRTALGRFKHESATVAVNRDGRIVCYLGDDEIFQYIYKFVSAKAYDPEDRAKNAGLLDSGTLYVARFDADNSVAWMPLTHGKGPLTRENGFSSQADVLIETRRAAKLLGATPMDRPEDIEVDPKTGIVYVALTKNGRRGPSQIDSVNPRPRNRAGHIIEILPARAGEMDHAATASRWRFLLLAGNPKDPEARAAYNLSTSADGWLACPDNLVFDPKGRLWISTDGADAFGIADGLWATDVAGPGRALPKHFFRCPTGAELTGPAFTPDGTTLFCSVQHPGDGDNYSFVNPGTRWPDFEDGVPPRPSVIAIRRQDGKPLG